MAITDDLGKIDLALQGLVTPTGYSAVVRIYQNPTEKVVTTAELPCFIIMPRGDPDTSFQTFGVEQEIVTWAIQFLYKPVGQGTLNDNYQDILAYRNPTRDALYAHLKLYSTVNWILPIKCSLPRELLPKWGSLQFMGFETLLRVVSTRVITFGD